MQRVFIKLSVLLCFESGLYGQSLKYDSLNRASEISYNNGTKVYSQIDGNGNRSQNSYIVSIICSGANASFQVEHSSVGSIYQWQVDTGSGFINIINDTVYSGATTNILALKSPPTSWYGNVYHCLINGIGGSSTSNPDTLKFVAVWYGGKDNAWENPANWACNKVPDENTDVIIFNNVVYHPIVNSNQSIRSLTGNQKSKLIVTAGNVLHIAIPNL